MTKQPLSFERWLRYHRDALGVERFYIRVEDTPELESLLKQAPWVDIVDASFAEKTVRDWVGQTARQAMHVKEAITTARRDGLTHLLHIDDDELVFPPAGLHALSLGAPSKTNAAAGYMEGTALLPPHVCVVLHFESCEYARWRRKFSDYARRHTAAAEDHAKLVMTMAGMQAGMHVLPDTHKDPGFAFYQASWKACLELVKAIDAKDQVAERAAEARCVEVWAGKRREPPGLPPTAPVFERERPQILHDEGLTLIPPLVDSATGEIRLPPGHLKGCPEGVVDNGTLVVVVQTDSLRS